MKTEVLAERLYMLQQEYQNAKQNLAASTEQYEKAQIHLHMISGRLQEVSYLVSEQQKAQDAQIVKARESEFSDNNQVEQ